MVDRLQANVPPLPVIPLEIATLFPCFVLGFDQDGNLVEIPVAMKFDNRN